MKIYTKSGDAGKTSLVTGKRVSKAHERLEAYGTIDELNSNIGLLIAYEKNSRTKDFLLQVQHKLFNIGSILATDDKEMEQKLPTIASFDIEPIELEIDYMNEFLPELKNFILPGGSIYAAHCQIVRTVCRRAERRIVLLTEHEIINNEIVKYINRLSDFLFVLARYVLQQENISEIYWKKS